MELDGNLRDKFWNYFGPYSEMCMFKDAPGDYGGYNGDAGGNVKAVEYV